MSEQPSQEELHSPDYQPPERENAEEVEARRQSELEAERDYHNRRGAGELTEEEKADTALAPKEETSE